MAARTTPPPHCGDPRGENELAAVLDLGSKLVDVRLEAHDLIPWIAAVFPGVQRSTLQNERTRLVHIRPLPA
jgi:hypothetical protein